MAWLTDRKYGRIQIDRPTIDDEPAFVFRGQDRLAPVALRAYAGACRAMAAAVADDAHVFGPLMDHAKAVEVQADEMERWQMANRHATKLPD